MFSWCISAPLHEIDLHRGIVSLYKKNFTGPNQSGIQFPKKKCDIPNLGKLIRLNIKVFELTISNVFYCSMLAKIIKKTK